MIKRFGFSGLLLSAFLFIFLPASGQPPLSSPGNWLMYLSQGKLGSRTSLHAEFQYRAFDLLPNTEQLLFRTGFNYHISKDVSATVGYGRVINYDYDKDINPDVTATEHRLWEQFQVRSYIGRLALEHRYRIEQRWINGKQDTYLDRVRYLVRLSMPLNKEKIEKGTVFLTAYNEVFLYFTSRPFDRNRAYGAMGYQVSPVLGLQAGFLFQTVNLTTRPYLQLLLQYNFDLSRKPKQ